MASTVEEKDPSPPAESSPGAAESSVEAPTQPKSAEGGSESSVDAQSQPGLSPPEEPSEVSGAKSSNAIEKAGLPPPEDPSEASGSKSSDVIKKAEARSETELPSGAGRSELSGSETKPVETGEKTDGNGEVEGDGGGKSETETASAAERSELSGSEIKPSKPVETSEKTDGVGEVKGDGGDKESRGNAEATADLLSSLSVSNNPTDVDTPQIVLKSDILNEDVESEEASIIKTEYVDDTPYTSAKTFEDLKLSENLLRGLYSEMKFERPSRIQGATLPMILTAPYHNLIAQAHNGSGKTTCFVLGMLSRVDPQLQAPQAICVCPTRELAIQNEQVLLKMGKFTGITSVCAIPSDSSGYSSTRRERIIDQVVIGTPGTLKRWISFRTLDIRQIKILVFDEADHMLDQDGFQDDSVRIFKSIVNSRGGCQVLLFSATFDDKVKAFAMRTIPRANHVFVKKEELSLDVIKQYRVKCPNEASKTIILKDRIFPAAEKLGQSIIFVRSRASASELHWRLEADGHKCTSIQGGLSNEDRDRVIREFRGGQTKILIATDVLARGFDQAQVTLVVNYDLPMKHNAPYGPDYELYLHRIGRSGRFGRKGAAFNLVVTRQDEDNLDKIARHFNRYIPEVQWDNDDHFETVLKEAGLA